MNFGKSFTYIFDDPDWFSKLWKPVLCLLIPIIGPFIWQGYLLNVTKNVVNGGPRPLHHMDFSDELSVGFKYFLIELVYSIPIVLLALLPSLLIPGAMELFRSDANSTSVAIGIIVQLAFTVVSFFVSAFYMFVFPAISANVAVKGTFESGFEFKTFFAMFKRNLPAWLLVLAGQLLAGLIAPIGAIVLIIGAIVTSAYAGLMTAHLAGQAYRESQVPIASPPNVYPPI